MRRSLHAFRSVEVCGVLSGKKTTRGTSLGDAGECFVMAFAERSSASVVCGMPFVVAWFIRAAMLEGEWLYEYAIVCVGRRFTRVLWNV